MKIYLLRSSLVVDDAPSVPEAHRYLSLEGRRIVRAIGNKIRLTEEPSFARVVTSPSPAAVQTAELFSDRTDYVGAIEVLSLLGAATTPPSIITPALQTGVDADATILVVSDEPILANLGAFLVGRPTFPPSVHGQVSVIEGRIPAWCLKPGEIGRQLLLVA